MLGAIYIIMSIVAGCWGFVKTFFDNKVTIETCAIRELKMHQQVKEKQVKEMMLTIRQTGQLEPIHVDKTTNVIIDGHHRYMAMLQ
jgi:ParB-like chromosome segregation protein Spo0J